MLVAKLQAAKRQALLNVYQLEGPAICTNRCASST